MKTRRICTAVLTIGLLATLCFIWGNSMQSVEASQALSLGVLEKVRPVLEAMAGVGRVTDHLVRKLAHFAEFAALGMQLALLLIMFGHVRLQSAINCLFFGLTIAVLDETIQIFTYRGSQLQDVWLDFFGFCAGLAAALGLYLLIKAARRRSSRGNA